MTISEMLGSHENHEIVKNHVVFLLKIIFLGCENLKTAHIESFPHIFLKF